MSGYGERDNGERSGWVKSRDKCKGPMGKDNVWAGLNVGDRGSAGQGRVMQEKWGQL